MTTTYRLDAPQWNGTIDAAEGRGARKGIDSIEIAIRLLAPYVGPAICTQKWDGGDVGVYASPEDRDSDDTGANAVATIGIERNDD